MQSTSHRQHSLLLGATQGIGFALARRLGRKHHHVTVTGRSQASIDQALLRLRSAHPEGSFDGFILDLKDHQAAHHILAATAGPIDHLVLCGSSEAAWGPFESLTADALERALGMKVVGYLNAVQAMLPHLAPQGTVTFIGGAASRAAMAGSVGIAATNGALEAVTRSLARELAPRRVNLIAPGLTSTEFWETMPEAEREAHFASFTARLPLRRAGLPEESADAIAFVIANGYVTGSVIDVDGGWHLG
ncbi:SDR family NAD(P)-dependent oxidoreductase [Novosphingobium terrae]|uniref:SDR family NAD(P)-dependent oxidoreductase n=1 Tax=Novosphingobium terrae TaxID=2726189 RepID=UPI00197FCD15|nr:SDR family oxidoreductase [Novosphingobium terrae]